LNDILNEVQASEEEILEGLKDYNAIEIDGIIKLYIIYTYIFFFKKRI